MEYPFNDEIFDHDGDEVFQNNQLETDSLWCNSLVDISEYDNQFFHDDGNFNEVLTNNSNFVNNHDLNQLSFELEEENSVIPELELSPLRFKQESTFDSKLYNSIQKHNKKSIVKPATTSHKSKEKFEPFLIENLTQSKSNNHSTESHRLDSDIGDFEEEDLETITPVYSYSQSGDNPSDEVRQPNVYYYSQHNSLSNRQKPTIYLTKRNLTTSNTRKTITKLRKQDNEQLYSIYQDTDRNQVERMKYSLSPSTSSPNSTVDCRLSGTGFQQNFNDDSSSLFLRTGDSQNRFYEMKYKLDKTNRDGLYSSKISSTSRLFQSPIPQTGILILTEEEKRTLLLENYTIPTRLPLTKQEERNLKKVRRKIKNKISAQESRRKKKEYMEALEKKVEVYAHENSDLKKRLENQESLNKSLLGQLRHLQQVLGRAGSNTASTCLMVFLLCFSLILVGMPDRLETMRPPQSVLVVSNIHKFGYGSLGNIQKTKMTAMQRYLPPDINELVDNSDITIISVRSNDSSLSAANENGNITSESILNVNNIQITSQRKAILLGNSKEEEEDCVQYGPKYSLWFLFPNELQKKQAAPISDDDQVPLVLVNEDTGIHDMVVDRLVSYDGSGQVSINISQTSSIDQLWSNNTDDQMRLSFFSIST